jgi:lambda family phage minor tail protein L
MPAPQGFAELTQDAVITLYEISGFNLSNPTESQKFCNHPGVSFNGENYESIACEGSGFDLIGQGSLQNPELTIANTGRVISDLLYRLTNTPGYKLEGSTVTRTVTRKKYLDGQPSSNAAVKNNLPDVYVLDQVMESTYLAVKIKLSTQFDLEGATIPGRFALRTCGSKYRGSECSYMGSAMYTILGVPTLDPAQDVCSKTQSACKLRFGEGNILPYGGFPALGAIGG